MDSTDRSNRGGHRRIAYVIGARPNFVKMAPVIAELSVGGPRRARMCSSIPDSITTG